MHTSAACIRRTATAILVTSLVLFAGSSGHHGVSSADEVPTITVVVQYPGATADTMAVSVAAPLERRLVAIPGIVSISSANTAGRTEVTLAFEQKQAVDAAAPDVQSAISAVFARLPQDLPTPAIVARGGDR